MEIIFIVGSVKKKLIDKVAIKTFQNIIFLFKTTQSNSQINSNSYSFLESEES